MSFLAPWFLLGGLALSLPVIFHLIRRTTREQTLFSSLMFLQPTPPRLTRKSRLEHWLLLLLRCLALGLLALGFARPFLKGSSPPEDTSAAVKRVVLLLDTSASMRREGLWAAARTRAETVLRKLSPADQVAVFTFDRQVTPLLSFDQWKALPAGDRVAQAVSRLAEINPSWFSTQLGNALVRGAEELADLELTKSASVRQLILISDLQAGSRLDQLQAYDWPKGIQLLVEPLKPKSPSNAGLQLVTESADTDRSAELVTRVRVSNSADAKREQFQVGWARTGESGFAGPAVDVYVPPGQSRVITVPTLTNAPGLNQIRLQGDDEPFDNTVFVLPLEATQIRVLYFGAEAAENTRQPLFFLRRALSETRRQALQVVAHPPGETLTKTEMETTSLFFVTDALADGPADQLRERMLAGKTVVFAPKNAVAGATLTRWVGGERVPWEEAAADNYAILSELDLQHPLFAPFADPRFSDFTKIHFWKYRRLDTARIPGARVIGRFDSGAAALFEVPIGKGRLLVLTSGWHPDDSQLALSSKFVPLLYSLLEFAGGSEAPLPQLLVGDSLPSLDASGATVKWTQPDGTPRAGAAGATNVAATAQPGIYRGTSSANANVPALAVNLDPNESRTTPLALDEFERLGAPVTGSVTPEAPRAAERHVVLQASEAENRQKLWRWMLFAALAILVVESILAGWTARQSPPPEGTPA